MKTRVRIIVEAEVADNEWRTTGDTGSEFTFTATDTTRSLDLAHEAAVRAAAVLRKERNYS